MPTRFKKTRKLRGHVSMGHGRIGKHRKHPGGRGLAGGQHHHRTNMDRFHPGYFGKVGMCIYRPHKNARYLPATNVEKLNAFIDPEDLSKVNEGILPVIDLTQHGYFKLLARGVLQAPCIVKVRQVTPKAEQKVKEAGGAIILTA